MSKSNDSVKESFVKSSCIKHFGYKAGKDGIIVDEVGLPYSSSKPNRRADLCLLQDGKITIFEIKVSVQDFKNDSKFLEYRRYCNYLCFVIPDSIYPKVKDIMEQDKDKYKEVGLLTITSYGRIISEKRKSIFNYDRKNKTNLLDIEEIKNVLQYKIKYRYLKLHEKNENILRQIVVL